MISLDLHQIAEVIDASLAGNRSSHFQTLDSTTVVSDSRQATPGCIFFALQGETTHGHDFAAEAVANGAQLVVAETDLPIDAPVLVVSNSLEALSALAKHVIASVRRAGRLKIVAITGSNGKTTTKNMLKVVLSKHGSVVSPTGSFNNQVGVPLTLLRTSMDTDFIVVEMGASGPGQIAHLVSIVEPDVAIVLKVGMAHAGGFGGIEQTAIAKSEIVRSLPASAVAVLNLDDARVWKMREVTAARIVSFGLSEQSDYQAINIASSVSGSTFTVRFGNQEFPASLKILGEHMVMNALATMAAAAQLGIDIQVSIATLKELELAERWRMQVFPGPNGSTIINDAYNASPDSVAAALKTLAELTRGRSRAIAVLGEMAELGEFSGQEHDQIGRLVVRLNIDSLIVVGKQASAIHRAAELEGSWNGESMYFATADEAYDHLRGVLERGDVVLVKSSNSAGLRLLGDRLAEQD